MYQIGDYVVKSANGVCKINDINQQNFLGKEKKLCYQLMPLTDEKATIYVSVEKADRSIRAVLTKEEAQNLIQKIPEIKEPWIYNEKERERNYKEAIQSNNPERLIGIVKLIYQRKQGRQKQGKKVPTVDERYFDIAENRLYSELELVLGKNRNEIYELIKSYCE